MITPIHLRFSNNRPSTADFERFEIDLTRAAATYTMPAGPAKKPLNQEKTRFSLGRVLARIFFKPKPIKLSFLPVKSPKGGKYFYPSGSPNILDAERSTPNSWRVE